MHVSLSFFGRLIKALNWLINTDWRFSNNEGARDEVRDARVCGCMVNYFADGRIVEWNRGASVWI